MVHSLVRRGPRPYNLGWRFRQTLSPKVRALLVLITVAEIAGRLGWAVVRVGRRLRLIRKSLAAG
jgi:hypothetical protein